MAFPSILGFGGTNSGASVTETIVDIVTLVGGTPRIGDLVIILIAKDGTGAFTWPAGWTSLNEFPITFAATNNQGVGDARYRYIQTGDDLTVNITHDSEATAHQVYWINGTGPLRFGTAPECEVITGSSTNPDPPSISPSWGTAEDTLFLVFAGNDGNVAITAAPTNYTNFQNDRWANNGGVGVASARRNLNASSEDPGVFSMLTEQWFAATVAISGGLNVDLNFRDDLRKAPEFIPPKPSLGLAGLTLAVNLLQSTLAPVESPIFQSTYDNPQPDKPPAITHLSIPTDSFLNLGDIGFNQYDWPLPAPVPKQLLVSIESRLSEDVNIAFNKLDWPNPDLKKPAPHTWVNNLQETTLAPVVDNPIFVTEQPLRFAVKPIANTWIDNSQQDTLAKPFFSSEKPATFPAKKIALTWIQNRPIHAQDTKPFNQNSWPVPDPKKLKERTWNVNLLQNTLKPADANPLINSNWPVSGRKPYLIIETSGWIYDAPPTEVPFYQETYNPILKRKSTLTWSVNRPFYYQDTKPFNQNDYPNPALTKKAALTFIHTKKLDDVVESPIVPVIWNNPSSRKNPVLDWSYLAPFQQIFTSPVGNSSYNVPLVRPRFENKDWIQSRPFYYSDVVSNPFFQVSWYNPPAARLGIIVDISTRFPEPSSLTKPFNQNEWRTPARKPAIIEGWEVYFVVDENQPDRTQFTSLPIRRRLQTLSWIQPALVTSPVFTPIIGNQLFDVPLFRKRIAESFINPSLSVVQLPTGQVEWPNPDRIRILSQSWIQNKPSYYEEDLPIRQLDWSNPFTIIQQNKGYIRTQQIEDVSIIIPYDLSIPVLVKRQTESYIVNLLQSTLEPAPGDTPFNQTNYPNPLLKLLMNRGWTLERNFSIEAVQPFNQLDWPLVLIKKVINRDFVFTVIPVSEIILNNSVLEVPRRIVFPTKLDYTNPINTALNVVPTFILNDYPNPLRKKVSAITHTTDISRLIAGDFPFRFIEWPVSIKGKLVKDWIQSPIVILSSIPGEFPFAQIDYPNPIRIKKLLFDLTGQNYIILPQIRGRVICLLSDATEYDLESAIEELDLDSMMTIYDLESGGTECQ